MPQSFLLEKYTLKNARSSLLFSIVGSFLVLGLTTGLSAKEAGPYMHGGITYWDGLEAPDIDFGDEEIDLEANPLEYEVDGSRAQLSIGIGYNLDEQWGFEAFYVSTPERVLAINDLVVPDLGIDETFSVSWRTTFKHTVFGINAVYDVYLNENLSLFGKAGIAFTRHTADASVTFAGQTTPIGGTESLSFVEEEDTDELFGAIGARIPIRAGDASITFAYQFVETSDGREPSLELGIQWNF